MTTPITESQVRSALQRLGNLAAVGRELGIPETTLRRRTHAWGIQSPHPRAERTTRYADDAAPGEPEPASAEIIGDIATITLPAGTPFQPEQLLRDHGLDPGEWIVTTARPNSWNALAPEGRIVTLHQFKVEARRIVPLDLTITLPTDWVPQKPKPRRSPPGPELIPLFADPHFPLHEPALYEASLAFLDEHSRRIRRVVCLGDEGDWNPFKRHAPNKRIDVSVNEALAGTFEGLAGWRSAAPDAEIDLIPGNHTYWLEKRVQEQMGGLSEMRRPLDDCRLLSMRSLLHLDHLRINYHETRGEYHDSVIDLAPDLVLMHGTKTGKHGGATKEQEGWEGASVVQGHDHALAVTAINRRRSGGRHSQRYAVSAAAMARRDLGYSPKQDVGQGWVVVVLWPDGRWGLELAQYDPDAQSTVWRDWRYAPRG